LCWIICRKDGQENDEDQEQRLNRSQEETPTKKENNGASARVGVTVGVPAGVPVSVSAGVPVGVFLCLIAARERESDELIWSQSYKNFDRRRHVRKWYHGNSPNDFSPNDFSPKST
jgi:hypothetical protein